MPRDALIVGLGLIGGSIALRLRERGWRVRYLDPHVSGPFERADGIDDRSLLILATPVDVALEYLTPRAGMTTTVCSVMRPLRAAAPGRFVAGHPMAGSEESGFAAARADLFEGKPWFLDADDEEVEQLVRDCGAVPERVDAAEHDHAVALTSHLPQVVSTALAALVADDDLRFAGSGLKTFLRLAGSSAEVWKPVIEANRDNIAEHAEALERVVRDMLRGDMTAFEKAQRMWRRL
jgi:prephenate dehydrogenase